MFKLNRSAWLRACLVGAVALALFGCDDGGGGNEERDTSSGDMTSGGDTTTTPDQTSAPDGDEDVTNPGDATTTPDTTVEDMSPDLGPEVQITWPANPQDYVDSATTVSYISQLTIPGRDPLTDTPTCCKDFGRISRDYIESDGESHQIDNAIAELAATVASFDFNLQETLDEQIQAGTVAILWDHREFGGTGDENFVLAGLLGGFEGTTTYAEASSGTGTFVVNPSSFASGGTPIIHFNPAVLSDNELAAGPSTFLLSLPLGVVTLEVAVAEAELTGTATISDDGVAYANGTLSGYVFIEEIVRALNAFVRSETCDCLGLTGDPFTYNQETGQVLSSCLPPATLNDLCPEEEQSVCRLLSGEQIGPVSVCSMLPNLLQAAPDLDTSGDCQLDPDNCVYDAISVGLQWTAVPATLAGLDEN